jgi:thioredoxin reductase
VVLFTNGEALSDTEGRSLHARTIPVVEEPVLRLSVVHDRLTGVQLATGHVPRDAVFVRPTFVPNDDLLTSVGCETDARGWVVVDDTGRTSVPGAWAAGNATNPRAQVITAAGEGSTAAIAINNDLVEADVRAALARSGPTTGEPA